MTKEILLAIIGLISSGGIATILTLLLNRKKTAAETRKVDVDIDQSVLTSQHTLLEKLLERSQKLVEDNEKLNKDYGTMIVENAKLRAEVVNRDSIIASLQKDTKAMRIEVQAIMERVKQIDHYLQQLENNGDMKGSNSNPFAANSQV